MQYFFRTFMAIPEDKTTFTSLVCGYDSDGSATDIQRSGGETYFSGTTTKLGEKRREKVTSTLGTC